MKRQQHTEIDSARQWSDASVSDRTCSSVNQKLKRCRSIATIYCENMKDEEEKFLNFIYKRITKGGAAAQKKLSDFIHCGITPKAVRPVDDDSDDGDVHPINVNVYDYVY